MPRRASDTIRLGPADDDEPTDLSEPARAELVAEALAVFGEDAAAELARLLRVPFDSVLSEASV